MSTEYKTLTGDSLVSAVQLDELALDGWALVQIVPYYEGSIDLLPGQTAIYLRREVIDA